MVTLERNAKTELDREVDAWNAAFDALELDCRWNRAIAAELSAIPDDGGRVVAYLRAHRPHLLKVYPPEFLADAISGTKARLQSAR